MAGRFMSQSAGKEISQLKQDFVRHTSTLKEVFDRIVKKASQSNGETATKALHGLRSLTMILEEATESASEVSKSVELETPSVPTTARDTSPPRAPSPFVADRVEAMVVSDGTGSALDDSSSDDEDGNRHFPESTGGQRGVGRRRRQKRVAYRINPHDMDVVLFVVLDLLNIGIKICLIGDLCVQSDWNKWLRDDLNIYELIKDKIEELRRLGGSTNYLLFSSQSYKNPFKQIVMRNEADKIISERKHVFHSYGESCLENFIKFHRDFQDRYPSRPQRKEGKSNTRFQSRSQRSKKRRAIRAEEVEVLD